MTATVSTPLPAARQAPRLRGKDGPAQPDRVRARERAGQPDCDVLASYLAADGRSREVLRLAGPAGSALVIDRDATTLADRRLLAHLAPDEPPCNAEIVCEQYMRDRSPIAPRQVTARDLRVAPPRELDGIVPATPQAPAADPAAELTGPGGERFRLCLRAGRTAIPELRWCRTSAAAEPGAVAEVVVLRDVVGCLESYEPARTMTALALQAHRDDRQVSVARLLTELERLTRSRTVLNRGLRESVLAALQSGRCTMSEIASRCGRIKRADRGDASGETTWLARKLGLASAGGGGPTPWVHSDVLALVAREGIGVSPHEVELA